MHVVVRVMHDACLILGERLEAAIPRTFPLYHSLSSHPRGITGGHTQNCLSLTDGHDDAAWSGQEGRTLSQRHWHPPHYEGLRYLYTGITSAILSKLWKPKKIVISVEWDWDISNQWLERLKCHDPPSYLCCGYSHQQLILNGTHDGKITTQKKLSWGMKMRSC